MRDERTALLDVVESFLLQRHDLSPVTAENYRRRLVDFARWCEFTLARSATVGDLEGGTVDAFLGHLRLHVSAQTARSAWVALRSLAQYLANRRIHDDGGQSALRLVRMPKVKEEWRRALSDDEMFRLMQVASEGEFGHRDSAIVMTLLGCGLRRGELVGLRMGDVNLRERRIHVRASSSKSVHPRDVTVPIETLKALDLYLEDYPEDARDQDAPLFTDRRGEALTGNAVRKLFERLAVRSGIRDLCAHMLRHTWATNFHRSGSGSRFDLMAEGGWSTGRVVERYTKARPFEERRRAPSPFTASRHAQKEKRPVERGPSPKISALSDKRTAARGNSYAVV
ncbi:MAG TPA: tyrosine-type recombinase/integrase [Candidatus Limnocylindria bacterium]|nr:tyrosine-type recombinase/integrase [Candidatus Limnocylindria bacterium]